MCNKIKKKNPTTNINTFWMTAPQGKAGNIYLFHYVLL